MTDYEKVTDKLNEIGAVLVADMTNGTVDFEPNLEADFYDVSGKGLIVVGVEDGRCGLYTLVGKDGEPVKNDLAFIEKFAAENKLSKIPASPTFCLVAK